MRMIQRVSADEDEAELHDDIVVPGITTLRHVTRDRGSNLGFAEAGFHSALSKLHFIKRLEVT